MDQQLMNIVPLADGSTHDDENLVARCKSCHSNIPIGSNNIKRQQDDQNYPVGYINLRSFHMRATWQGRVQTFAVSR